MLLITANFIDRRRDYNLLLQLCDLVVLLFLISRTSMNVANLSDYTYILEIYDIFFLSISLQ